MTGTRPAQTSTVAATALADVLAKWLQGRAAGLVARRHREEEQAVKPGREGRSSGPGGLWHTGSVFLSWVYPVRTISSARPAGQNRPPRRPGRTGTLRRPHRSR